MTITMSDSDRKYALIKLRRLREVYSGLSSGRTEELSRAFALLNEYGLIDYGLEPENEFFVIRLKDKYASDALFRYSLSARMDGESDYGRQIEDMAIRADNHPDSKKPD